MDGFAKSWVGDLSLHQLLGDPISESEAILGSLL